ncbi:MAG: hypothetical protein HRU24_15960 [Gammaproteobacteria bacterium]|nr:hypothetical protein [Gammaproteobacteria bacterium]
MSKQTKGLIASLSIVATIIFILNFINSDSQESTAASTSTRQLNIVKYSDLKQVNTTTQINDETTDFQYCENIVEQQGSLEADWLRDVYPSWNKYLKQGHSLDEITLVIDKLLNSNFGASFRIGQLRTNADLTKTNRELNKALSDYDPELQQLGFSISMAVPSDKLKDYASLSDKEQRALLMEVQPSVDDLAYFINQPQHSNNDILELLAATKNPKAIIGFRKLETTSLLNYAVIASRLPVFKQLLQLGLTPTNDSYLGSTMEWALAALTYNHSQPENSAKIVLKLIELGAKARFEQQDSNHISGDFPRNYYSFTQAEIDNLLQSYQLDLTLVESRFPLQLASDSLLMAKIKQLQAEYLDSQLNIEDREQHIASCQETMTRVKQAWQPKENRELLKQAIANSPDSKAQVELSLAKIDPSLVDCYQKNDADYRRNQRYLDNIEHILKPLRKGEILPVIDQLTAMPLTNSNKNWLFSQILGWDASFYDELISSELLVDPLQYFDFRYLLKPESLTKLAQSGAELDGVDSRGKTLMFYGVAKGDLNLLHYLAEERLPFSLISSRGQDPLHLALNTSRYQFSSAKLIAIVNILMSYHPTIDSFHLSRMALIQLKYPKLYQQIIDIHPSLSIISTTKLPVTLCNN